MYVPPPFRIDDPTLIRQFVQAHAFAALCTNLDGTPFVSHLPFLIDGECGVPSLSAHMAKANPQWRSFEQTALVIFSGPHAYISPRHYAAVQSVPTWNYAAIHVYGTASVIRDDVSVLDVLRRSVRLEESAYAEPWDMEALTGDYLRDMLQGIVAFRIVVSRIEAKFKLSQNRPADDRARVANALAASDDGGRRQLAELMATTSV